MKLPKSFRPDKDLEEKTKQLSEESIITNSEMGVIEPRLLYTVAKKLACECGRAWTFGGYIFEDTDDGLVVDFSFEAPFDDSRFSWEHIQVRYCGNVVLEVNRKTEIWQYSPGDWEDVLIRHYVDKVMVGK